MAGSDRNPKPAENLRNSRAFTDDISGMNLPDRFRPWHAIGVVTPDKDPPRRLPRDQIEKAISEHGFQLQRMKAKPR